MNNACCQLNGSVPRTAGSTKALMIVKTGETMLKKINEIIRVANKRYLILFLYVSFGTPNNAVNHLPIAVNGIKFEIRSDNMRAITKLVAILSQSIVTKEIVKTPDSKSDCAEIADAKHKKNETGISHIKLYTSKESLNFIGLNYRIKKILCKNYFVEYRADAKAQVKLYPPQGPSISRTSPMKNTPFSFFDSKFGFNSSMLRPPTLICENSKS